MKTQIADWLFVYNPVEQIISNKINVKLKIFYFTLEICKEAKMIAAFSNILYVKEGIRISPSELESTKKDKLVSKETLDLIKKYSYYFDKLEETVEFIDNVRNPTGIYEFMKEYASKNGVQHKKVVDFKDNKTGEITKVEIDDYYEPHDPEEYVMIVIDHIGLISTEKKDGKPMNIHESIVHLSSNYLIRLRNKFNYIPVVIQQQASSQESIENLKVNRLKPTLDGLGDCKLTQRDANVVLGLFSPFRHELKNYYGYDTIKFKDHIRFLEILADRGGKSGIVCPLYFDGATNYFKELPLSTDTKAMNEVYHFLTTIK